MEREMRARVFVSVTLLCLLFVIPECPAQNSPSLASPNVVLVKLSQPDYPPIARQARVTGDVEVEVGIRRDGSVDDARAVSGPSLLRDAALKSARQSSFECAGCDQSVTSYQLLYTFEIFLSSAPHSAGANECSQAAAAPALPPPRVAQTLNHVTLTEYAADTLICDVFPIKRRSISCLYLWRCGS
jgi:TonB family protein